MRLHVYTGALGHPHPPPLSSQLETRQNGSMNRDQEQSLKQDLKTTLEVINSHHSVRHYSPHPVAEETLEAIVTAAQRASTSSSQNAWSVVAVTDPERKKALQEMTRSNLFINDAPLFLVWIADLSRNKRVSEEAGVPTDAMKYQEALLVATIDAALAAQNAAVAAESLGLGICYVGGIRTDIKQVSELLDLPEQSYPVFGMTIGYPAPNDPAGPRPRLPLESVLFHEQYDHYESNRGVDSLEAANRHYFERQGRENESWKNKAASRWRDAASLHGRAGNSKLLAEKGFDAL